MEDLSGDFKDRLRRVHTMDGEDDALEVVMEKLGLDRENATNLLDRIVAEAGGAIES